MWASLYACRGEHVEQNGLTVITQIKQDRMGDVTTRLAGLERRLKQILQNMGTVHYAAFLAVREASGRFSELILETTYDGEEGAHLDALMEYAGDELDQLYDLCDNYPGDAKLKNPKVREYLKKNSHPSSAFYAAFPGRSVADINNAITVYQEAKCYIQQEQTKPFEFSDSEGHVHRVRSGFDDLTTDQIVTKLVYHFRSGGGASLPMLRSMTNRTLYIQFAISMAALSFLLLLFVLAAPLLCRAFQCSHRLKMAMYVPAVSLVLVPIALLLITRLYEIREKRESRSRSDPTAHSLTEAQYLKFDLGRQNHLCTYSIVKPSRFRRFMVKTALFVGGIAARRVFIFGKLGAMATIHFARWILLDGKDKADMRVLFLSNFDGSWASYLGDFSELVGYGINAIWANVLGFPPTRFLFWGGAYNIEPYEQEVRKHFHPADFFYRAYGEHSVRNIQRYLEFRDDLAKAIAAAEEAEKRVKHISEEIDRSDIQGIVASGYGHLNHARFVFLRVLDSDDASSHARSWLRSITGKVTTAEHDGGKKHCTSLNIAFTWDGLRKLGLPSSLINESTESSLYGFAHEFVGGMNRREAAEILGDKGISAPDQWQFGGTGRQTKEIHILVLLYAKTSDALISLFNQTCDTHALKDYALEVVLEQDSVRGPDDTTEPFGFRDGVSQPHVIGLAYKPTWRIEEMIRTGEFVLGYVNEYGLRTRLPSVMPGDDPHGMLFKHPDDPEGHRAFGMNGTYLVFRKLSQDVDQFWTFVGNNSNNDEERELFAARLMGRWRSGAPLVLAPDHDIPALGRDDHINNSFSYTSADPDGRACPIGSHIRRANPRDSLPFPPSRALQLSKRHRIIRRGRKYCELDERSTQGGRTIKDKGIYFIALNGDLLRQFEFIQQNWMNNPTFQDLDNDSDPIVGGNAGAREFTIQSRPVGEHVCGLPRFVTVKGGGYFFLPGMRALKFLAS